MLDASTVINPAMQPNALGAQQLPAPPMQDVMRLENILNQGGSATERLNMVPSSMNDIPILQVQEPVTTESFDFKRVMLDKVGEMDKSYQGMMSQFSTMPTFSDYLLEKQSAKVGNEMRSYPEVAINGTDSLAKQIQQSTNATEETMLTSSEYSHALTKWGINSQMWMGKMNIITAAVGQVSQGFKTLFQAG